MYDGFGEPPALHEPDAVGDIARALRGVDIDRVLAGLPRSDEEAASACGLRGLQGDVHGRLREHFVAAREFFSVAVWPQSGDDAFSPGSTDTADGPELPRVTNHIRYE
ncbi:hypothetical protein [Streptomyces sp. NPDC002845]